VDTVKQRLEYLVELMTKGKHTLFAKKCGIPPGSFQAYIKGKRVPPTEHLMKLVAVYGINLNWLLTGEGEPFVDIDREGEHSRRNKVLATDPVVQLLYQEEQRAGITLSPEQRTVILKILRELISRDVRSIQELLRLIPGEEKVDKP
jgi:transcriptional regulator with XRE-family HTH domain